MGASMSVTRAGLAVLLLTGAVGAQVTERVSVGPGSAQSSWGGETVQFGRYVSADGRYVGFAGPAYLVGGTAPSWEVLVRDRQSGTTECVSVDSAGVPRGGDVAEGLAVSGDGRFVVFRSGATDLVPGDTNGVADIFLRDRLNATTERVSIDSSGVEGNGHSSYPALTDDGRYIVFCSSASNLVPGDTNGTWDIFVRDRQSGTTERVSLSTGGSEGNGVSNPATISADGRYVAFGSFASNLVSGDTNGRIDAFVHDRQTGVTQRVSVAPDGTQGDGDSSNTVLSADGRLVAFWSAATNLVAGDTNGMWDVFVHDLQTGTTERVSVGPGGVQGNAPSDAPWISDDGRFVSFASGATNLVPGGTLLALNVFVHDRQYGGNELVSTMTGGAQVTGFSELPSISANGRYVVFRSTATNLVPGDTNGQTDVFIHDRYATGFTSLCSPGVNNVIACPCGNQPSAPGHGCDNSSSTGGATLSATGIAYLSLDSLVFTTFSEKPNATSILLQGTASLPNGLVFGQGVRCAGGQLKRMYVKTAINGSITAPDFSASDPTVSTRSATLGVPIQPGETRYFLVFYRDSTVLGGCPALSTFNATQTGSATWWP
jgi:Tol biopolymer transport system component